MSPRGLGHQLAAPQPSPCPASLFHRGPLLLRVWACGAPLPSWALFGFCLLGILKTLMWTQGVRQDRVWGGALTSPSVPPPPRVAPSGSSCPTRGARRRASCRPRPSRRTRLRTSPCSPPPLPPPVSVLEAPATTRALSASCSHVWPRALGLKGHSSCSQRPPWPPGSRPLLHTSFMPRPRVWVSGSPPCSGLRMPQWAGEAGGS